MLVGILIGSVGILIGSVGILIHWYFEHWYFERWYFEPLPCNDQHPDNRETGYSNVLDVCWTLDTDGTYSFCKAG